MCKNASLFLLLTVSVTVAAAQSDSPNEIEQHLKVKYEGKVLTLRTFYTAERLKYTAEGNPIKAGQTGPWTIYGLIEVNSISVKIDKLEILGNRRLVIYDQKQQRLS